MRYGMVIDLAKCTGCQACTIACKAENSVPSSTPDDYLKARAIFWHRVISVISGKYPNVRMQLYPMPCFHCENAPCVKVCPVQATYKRQDGLVMMDYEKCIGCKYCMIACPYGARSFNFKHQDSEKYSNPDVPLRRDGVVEKCTFCVHRIDKAVKEGKKFGNPDGEVTTACNEACPANARYFGDLDDSNSEVSKLIARRKAIQLRPDLGTNPQVYYLV